MKVKSLSRVQLFVTPWTVAYRHLQPWNFPGKNTGVGAISFSRVSSRPRVWTQVSHIAGRRFTVWATKEALTVAEFKNCLFFYFTAPKK